jgi:Disulphide bond corrector protein DsbC
MRWMVAAVLAFTAPLTVAAFQLPQGLKSQPLPLPEGTSLQSRSKGTSAVQFLFPAQVRVEARHPVLVDLRFRVGDGLHINSHAPHEKNLIATRLAVIEGQGIRVNAVDFPPGADYALAFSPKQKVNVYTGEFILQAHLIAEPGEHLLAAQLHYQACDANACMPPRDLPIVVSVIAK